MKGLIFTDRLLVAWCSAILWEKDTRGSLTDSSKRKYFFCVENVSIKFFQSFPIFFFFRHSQKRNKGQQSSFFFCGFQVFSQTLRPLSSLQGPSSNAIPLWSYWQRGCPWMEHVAAVREGKDQWCGLASSPSLIWKLLWKYCTLKKFWLCLANVQDSLSWEIFLHDL